jgi:hypothetical protein
MVAVVAALAGTLGDLLLLATSNATRPGFEWLPAPSEAALLAGTFLGVAAIPCYGLGYRAIAARFAEPYRRWIGGLGVAGPVLGGTTHGLTGLVIHVERSGGAAGVDPVTVGLVLAGATSAAGRAFLVPAAPNVAHVVFFGVLSVVMVPLDTPRRAGH